ncbi:MAG: FAD-dependent monooxygenase [Deltaproteobacteria bacterium]|nr:FAD-dependent monooxygenase [Deltaproteobacteria bacterium]
MTDVLIVGAGPVGLVLTAELRRHGIANRIVDALPAPSPYCRAIGVSPRSMEVFDDIGVVEAAIEAGVWLRSMRAYVNGEQEQAMSLDGFDLPFGSLALPRNETERVLTEHLARLGGTVERRVQLTGLQQDDAGAASFSDGAPRAGERAPDARGLRREGSGAPLRAFDLLRGTRHVLFAWCPTPADVEAATAYGPRGPAVIAVRRTATSATAATASRSPAWCATSTSCVRQPEIAAAGRIGSAALRGRLMPVRSGHGGPRYWLSSRWTASGRDG